MRASLVLAALLASAACRPCPDGVLQVELTFQGAALDAARARIEVTVGGEVVAQEAALDAASGAQIVHVSFPSGYPAGETATVVVTARDDAGQIKARGRAEGTLGPGCQIVAVTLGDGGATTLKPFVAPQAAFDVLFVIDNSPGMAQKQTELRARLAGLAAALTAAPLHYHFGVITSDLGAAGFTVGTCSGAGGGGKLVALGPDATPGCEAPVGKSFIDFDARSGSHNLPIGFDVAQTLSCMAAVGDLGCDFEQPLEALYVALHDQPAGNEGFLRPAAGLLVFFITDEDDCSVPAGSDLFDPTKTATYGEATSYRCTRFGVACNGAAPPYGDSGGPLSGCSGATSAQGGKLTEVQKYIDWLRQPAAAGGLKADPGKVFLAALAGPAAPFSTALANPLTQGMYTPCAGPIGPTCAPVLQRSCIAAANPRFYGDPAVRLHQVIDAVAPPDRRVVGSICDAGYGPAAGAVGGLVAATQPLACVGGALPDPARPECVVEVGTADASGGVTFHEVPPCTDPPTPGVTCWRLEDHADCPAACAVDGEPAQRKALHLEGPAPGAVRGLCTVVTPPAGATPACSG